MINEKILLKIWKNNQSILYTNTYIEIELKNKKIFIINDKDFQMLLNAFGKERVRKNCLVFRKYYTQIYIHEDYIKSIIRQKLLNNLLND